MLPASPSASACAGPFGVYDASETRPSESVVLSAALMPYSTGPASGGLPIASLKSQPDSYGQLPATVKSLPADPSLQNVMP
ncbi:hypothetical protein Tco_0559877 [Tanacetum coccineum]